MNLKCGLHTAQTALAALVLILFIQPAFGLVKFQGYCQQGNGKVTVQGFQSTSSAPAAPPVMSNYPACTVNVYNPGTTTNITLYSDSTGTSKTNPFTADSNGYWYFYAQEGSYDVNFSGTPVPVPFTLGSTTQIDPYFQQPGTYPYASGSVPRPRMVKDADFINAADFGAVCDGVHDELAHINAATSYAETLHQVSIYPPGGAKNNGSAVLLPSGNCPITNTIVVPSNVRLVAQSVGSTYITPHCTTPSCTASDFPINTPMICPGGCTNTGFPVFGTKLENLVITCYYNNQSGYNPVEGATGVQMANTEESSGLSNLGIAGCHTGINLITGYGNQNSSIDYVQVSGGYGDWASNVPICITATNVISRYHISHVTCNGGAPGAAPATVPNAAIQLSNFIGAIDHVHCEEWKNCVSEINSTVSLNDINCDQNCGAAVVQMGNTGNSSVTATQISGQFGVTNAIQDLQMTGTPVLGDGGLFVYNDNNGSTVNSGNLISSDKTLANSINVESVPGILGVSGELALNFNPSGINTNYASILGTSPYVTTFMTGAQGVVFQNNSSLTSATAISSCTNAVPMVCVVASATGARQYGKAVITTATPTSFQGTFTILNISGNTLTLNNLFYPGTFISGSAQFSNAGTAYQGGVSIGQNYTGDPTGGCIVFGAGTNAGCNFSAITPAGTSATAIDSVGGNFIIRAATGLTPNTGSQSIPIQFTVNSYGVQLVSSVTPPFNCSTSTGSRDGQLWFNTSVTPNLIDVCLNNGAGHSWYKITMAADAAQAGH